jgi:pyruvate,orthophosphate dikinase
MFFDEERIGHFREMILASDEAARRAALERLLPYQREDFVGIFRAMGDRPVTIRLLDPPLHEFLPHEAKAQEAIARALGVLVAEVTRRTARLEEANPMLGHRGCRLAVTYPEIQEMQVRAIIEAACVLAAEGRPVRPEIMVPLVGEERELARLREGILATAEAVKKEKGVDVSYLVGTMIEVPRAALTAGAIARQADFFSYGTNDLTQMVYGISRDDAGGFLPDYVQKGLYPVDPFQSLDPVGVGRLVEISAKEGRATRPDLKLGICGEHGGDGPSVHFFHRAGLDYVSCSPYRLPTARLAAAQEAVREKRATA